MLKIPKGLKKKKKDKKNKKKEDELFAPEELEKYRKEHQQYEKSEEAAGVGNNSELQSDEWKKFKALTAGVDDVLKKTQGDLSRIKSTSFFQRKSPKKESNKSKNEIQEKVPDNYNTEEVVTEAQTEESINKFVEDQTEESSNKFVGSEVEKGEEADDEESDIDDNLFDTSYVEVVASGKIKLANIPDSPIEEDLGFDPFDTSIADQFVKSKQKKRFLNLGCAVEVLTGRVTDTTAIQSILDKKPRRRPKPQDLLLTSFDEENNSVKTFVVKTPTDSPVKTLLDDDPLFAENDQINSTSGQGYVNFTLDLSANYLPKKVENTNEDTTERYFATEPVISESSDDEFAKLAAESAARKSNAFTSAEELNITNAEQVESSSACNIVPFDVTFETDKSEFENSKIKTFCPNIPKLDVFSSVQGLTEVSHIPLEPNKPLESDDIFYDPFDTSNVDNLLPGKQEIKLLEKELLSTDVLEEDDDFNPRADELPAEKPIRPDQLKIKVEHTLAPSGQPPINIKSPSERLDLLKINHEDLPGHVAKPLTPLAPELCDNTDLENQFIDPFDTSCVNKAFGKLELKLIEKELTTECDTDSIEYVAPLDTLKLYTEVKETICVPKSENKDLDRCDILTGGDNFVEKLHTPVKPEVIVDGILEYDPFDTSIAENIKPGKTELKLLETELI